MCSLLEPPEYGIQRLKISVPHKSLLKCNCIKLPLNALVFVLLGFYSIHSVVSMLIFVITTEILSLFCFGVCTALRNTFSKSAIYTLHSYHYGHILVAHQGLKKKIKNQKSKNKRITY